MKKIIPHLLSCFFLLPASGQGQGNFFSQSRADIQYMIQQGAALDLMIGYLEKGYAIAQKKLLFIGNIKQGEFDLHAHFFHSLLTINPSLRNYSKIADIIGEFMAILGNGKTAMIRPLHAPPFSSTEINYLQSVYHQIADASSKSMQELVHILSDGEYQLSDSERMKQIDDIEAAMRDRLAFLQCVTQEAGQLALQRTSQTLEFKFLHAIH